MNDTPISTSTDPHTVILHLRAELEHVSDERDAADARCAELERHNETLTRSVLDRSLIIAKRGAIIRKLEVRLALALVALTLVSVLALLALFTRTAAAQDDAHRTYIPLTVAPHRRWFTPAELTAAMQTAGFDPDVVEQHTWCDPDSTSNPPADLRWRYCYQQWINGAPTDGSSGVLYQMLGDVVTPIYITTIHGASAASDDAPGCDADGNCG